MKLKYRQFNIFVMLSYMLIECSPGSEKDVINQISSLVGVVEVNGVWKIITQNNEWKIEFNTKDKDEKTIYNKSFIKSEFIDFLNDSNLLYQFMIMLMHLFSAITLLAKLTTNKLLLLLPYRD